MLRLGSPLFVTFRWDPPLPFGLWWASPVLIWVWNLAEAGQGASYAVVTGRLGP